MERERCLLQFPAFLGKKEIVQAHFHRLGKTADVRFFIRTVQAGILRILLHGFQQGDGLVIFPVFLELPGLLQPGTEIGKGLAEHVRKVLAAFFRHELVQQLAAGFGDFFVQRVVPVQGHAAL